MTECVPYFDVSEIDWIGLFVLLSGLTYCCSSWYSVKPSSSRDFRDVLYDDYLFNVSVWLFVMTAFGLGDWFAALGFLSQGVKMFFDFVAEVTYKPLPRIRRERNRWLSKNKRYSGKKWRAIHRSIAMHLAEKNKHRHRVSRRFYVNRAASTRRMLKLFKQWYYLNHICRPSVRHSTTSWNAKNTAYNHSYASSFYQTIARGYDPSYKHPVPDQKELLDFIDCGGVPLHLQGRFRLPSFSPVDITFCATDFVDHRHLLFLSYYYFEEDDSQVQVSTEAPSIDYVMNSSASSSITPFDNYLFKFLQELCMHLQWNYMKVWLKRWCLQGFCSCTSTIFALVILLSLPVLITAPNNAPTAGTSSIPAAASAVGTGIAAATSCALAVNTYSHRTRQWTRDENRLMENCRKYGVVYTPPSLDENEEKEHERRDRLEQECKTKQTELRRRAKAENEKKRRKLASPAQKAREAQRKRKHRAELTEEESAEVRRKAKEYQRQRKAVEDRQYEEDDGTVFIGKDRSVPFIDVSLEGVKEARRLLTRTAVDDDNQHHRAIGSGGRIAPGRAPPGFSPGHFLK